MQVKSQATQYVTEVRVASILPIVPNMHSEKNRRPTCPQKSNSISSFVILSWNRYPMWPESEGLRCRYAQHGITNAVLYASCLNVEQWKAERSQDAQSECCHVSSETQRFGHLFFRPSAHLPYKTSANCFVWSIPSTSCPGSCSCLTVHTSSAGSSEDWRRR